MMKPPPTPMIDDRKPMPAPSPRTGMTLTNSFDARKRIFSGRRWIQLCWPGFFSVGAAPPRVRAQRVDALDQHQSADGAEQHDVEQRDEEVELAEPAQQGEDIDAERRADDAAGQQHRAELEVERAALANAPERPEKDEAMTWLAPVATAMAGGML